MKVKDIVNVSAECLDLKNVIKYLNGENVDSEEVRDEINSLLLCINIVNNNIASSYIDLIGETKLMVSRDFVKYTDISSKSIIEIKNVLNSQNNKLKFKVLPEGLMLDYSGMVDVEFSYFPDRVNIDDEINYYLKLNEMIFSLGVVSEYLYLKGAVDDAYIWDKKFKNSMFNLLRPKKNIVMPSRRW